LLSVGCGLLRLLQLRLRLLELLVGDLQLLIGLLQLLRQRLDLCLLCRHRVLQSLHVRVNGSRLAHLLLGCGRLRLQHRRQQQENSQFNNRFHFFSFCQNLRLRPVGPSARSLRLSL